MTEALDDRLETLLAEFRAGRRTALARIISIVEDGRAGYQALLRVLHPLTGRASRVGMTGPPGAGKSTLTTALVQRYRARDERLGIVAVDPSSPFTGGALLGDRIRMNELATDTGVFIRSMATRGSLGGLALTTKEVADVMDAFGFDAVLMETVGVGQSELDIAAAADSTVVVLTPESGDSVQAMKAGLMEISDIFVINKADRPGADRLAHEVEMMLALRAGQAFRRVPAHHGVDLSRVSRRAQEKVERARARLEARSAEPAAESGASAAPAAPGPAEPGAEGWAIPVLKTSAETGQGVDELVATLDRHRAWLVRSGELSRRRRARAAERVRQAVERAIRERVWREGEAILQAALPALEDGRDTPYDVAARILETLLD